MFLLICRYLKRYLYRSLDLSRGRSSLVYETIFKCYQITVFCEIHVLYSLLDQEKLCKKISAVKFYDASRRAPVPTLATDEQ